LLFIFLVFLTDFVSIPHIWKFLWCFIVCDGRRPRQSPIISVWYKL